MSAVNRFFLHLNIFVKAPLTGQPYGRLQSESADSEYMVLFHIGFA